MVKLTTTILSSSVPTLFGVFSTSASLQIKPPISIRRAPMLNHYSVPIRLLGSKNDKDNGNGDKEQYTKTYKIQGVGKGSAVEMKTNTNHVLNTDVPIKMGGRNTAPQPVEHLLAALIGCTQATAVYVGRMMTPRLFIDKMDFDLEGYRDERGALQLPIEEFPSIPARLEAVSGVVKVYFKKGSIPTPRQLLVLKEQTEARCPVANMMHASGCKIDIEWINGITT
jgi:putative redox protein